MSGSLPTLARLWRGLFAVALLALPSAAAAQNPGPYGGLFGRTPPNTGQEVTRVEFRTTIGGQYDGLAPGSPSASDPNAPKGGTMGAANAGVGFERRRDRLQLRGRTSATYHEFFQTQAFGAQGYDADATVLAKLTTRFAIDGSVIAIRSPFYQLPFLQLTANPEVAVPGDRLSAHLLKNDTLEGLIGFTSQFTRRSSLAASISRREIRFHEQPEHNYQGWAARGDFRRRLSRDLSLHVSYGREEAHQKSLSEGLYVHEYVDAGFDLDRQISIARRTTLGFYMQPSMLRETDGPRRYRLNGGATIRRSFRRTWYASLLANRDTEFHPGFVAPLFSNGASVGWGGLFGPRTEWTGTIGVRRGQIGFDRLNEFLSYSGTTRLSTGLTKKTGLYAQYTYYAYELPPGSTVVGLIPELSRQQFAIGVTLWLPIFTHVRAPRDPR